MSVAGKRENRLEGDNYPTPQWCVTRLLEATRGLTDVFGDKPCPPLLRKARRWLEPCAGDGAIIRALQAYDPKLGHYIDARELRSSCGHTLEKLGSSLTAGSLHSVHVTIGDILDFDTTGYDVAITNPPFDSAERIIRHTLTLADTCAFLVRQGFVGHARAGWMRHDMPDTYELPDRPSFAASLKCAGVNKARAKREGLERAEPCDWAVIQGLEEPRPATCPTCNGSVHVTTSDAADYCWLVWTPERGRRIGRRVILADTPISERRVTPRTMATAAE